MGHLYQAIICIFLFRAQLFLDENIWVLCIPGSGPGKVTKSKLAYCAHHRAPLCAQRPTVHMLEPWVYF